VSFIVLMRWNNANVWVCSVVFLGAYNQRKCEFNKKSAITSQRKFGS